MYENYAGTQNLTADGAVGTSGTPVRVFSVNFLSGGGGAGVVILRNGTSAGATAYLQIDGTTSKGTIVPISTPGMHFPAGCFVDIDTNVSYCTVTYFKETA